jgi:hypothetical protein
MGKNEGDKKQTEKGERQTLSHKKTKRGEKRKKLTKDNKSEGTEDQGSDT